MSFSTVSTYRVQVGPLQECVRCLNDRVVQGGAQEATMDLQLHCRRKTRGSGNPEAAAILYVDHAANESLQDGPLLATHGIISHIRWTFASEGSLLCVPNLFN